MIRNAIEYLERSAERFPDKAAYVNDDIHLTFKQLRDTAKRIGSALTSYGTDKFPVAVYMEKTPLAIAAFFGVVYSGRCYSPIDSQMPVKRVEQILNTLNTKYLIVDEETIGSIDHLQYAGNVINVNNLLQSEIDEKKLTEIRRSMIDIDPLYIIFTSGSTGVPKGVVLSHRAVIDLAEWLGDTFYFDEETIFGNQTPFYFDASVKEIYSTIRNGATMYIIPSKLFGMKKRLFEYLNEKKINTILWATSALCIADTDKAFLANKPEYLKMIAFAGEAMPVHHLNRWRKYLPDALYVNLYGPTETAVDATYYIVDREFKETESLPIGRACQNMGILILKDDRETAVNEVGEICIRGTALANGYYGDFLKTRAVFVQNPLQKSYPELIYRTGDMGYYNENGEIMFAARQDDQIKHLGYRIELGEIETALSGIQGIIRCCCLFDKERDRIICVYTGSVTKREIILEAAKYIPKYMWPSVFVQLDEMPMTLNGKIDRVKLKAEYTHGKD